MHPWDDEMSSKVHYDLKCYRGKDCDHRECVWIHHNYPFNDYPHYIIILSYLINSNQGIFTSVVYFINDDHCGWLTDKRWGWFLVWLILVACVRSSSVEMIVMSIWWGWGSWSRSRSRGAFVAGTAVPALTTVTILSSATRFLSRISFFTSLPFHPPILEPNLDLKWSSCSQ